MIGASDLAERPSAPDRPLDGFRIGVTADRRWEEQAELLIRRGATVLHGPTIRTSSLNPAGGMREATERLIERPPDLLIANTGIGMRGWFSAADSWGLGEMLFDSLAHARIYARGPKASSAVQQWGLDVVATAPSERLSDLVTIVSENEPLEGARVLFQRHGVEAPETTAAFEACGAVVDQVSIYDWKLPDDNRPALQLVEAVLAHKVHAVTFTSAPAVHNLLSIAHEGGLAEPLRAAFAREQVLAVCVGPVCAGAATAEGLGTPLVPQRFRLGPLVRLLSDALLANEQVIDVGGVRVALRGSVVMVDGRRVVLTAREERVLAGLVARIGRVVSKDSLLREIWGLSGDTRVVEVTVGRLRRRLGPVGDRIVAVPRRGYLLDANPDTRVSCA